MKKFFLSLLLLVLSWNAQAQDLCENFSEIQSVDLNFADGASFESFRHFDVTTNTLIVAKWTVPLD